MSDKPEDSAANSLGLDLTSLKINDEQAGPTSTPASNDAPTKPEEAVKASEDSKPAEEAPPESGTAEEASSPADNKQASPQAAASKEKKKPYVNHDRVKTGGAQRDKLSEEELAERMTRIREQNEKIKLRREDVKKDEEEFRKTQEAEKVKQAKTKKVQENINRAREQNARRKMDKIQSREWDTGKPGVKTTEPRVDNAVGEANAPPPPTAKIGIRGGLRGGARGSFNRGRGRGTPVNSTAREEKTAEVAAPVPEASLEPAVVASS